MKIKKRFFKGVLALSVMGVALNLLIGCSSNSGTASTSSSKSSSLDNIRNTGKLVVGMSADYAPYEFHTIIDGKDQIVGFDVDVANEIASSLGVELEIREMDFGMLLAALQSGKIDMVISGMSPNAEREKSVDFSNIYYKAIQSILVLDSNKNIYTSLDDLANKKIGVQMGAIQASIAEEQIENANITELTKVDQLITELKSGKVDAVVVEKPVAETILTTNEDLFLTEIPVKHDDGGAAIAVKKSSSGLLDEVNNVIDGLISNGKIDEFVVNANAMVSN